MAKRHILQSLACAVVFLAYSTSQAGTSRIVIDDKFTDLSRNKTNEFEADWRKVLNIGVIDVTEDIKPGEVVAFGAPKVLRVIPEGNYSSFAGVFSVNEGTPGGEGTGVKLGDEAGDRLELSMEFRFLESGVKDLEIRVGLFNNAGTPSKDHTPRPYADDLGYWISLPQRGGAGAAYKELGKDGNIAGGADRIQLRAAVGQPIPALDDGWHTIVLDLKREKKGIVVQGKLDGIVFATGIDTTGPEDKMDPPGIITVFHEIGCAMGVPKNPGMYIRRVLLQGNPTEVATATIPQAKSGTDPKREESASRAAPIIIENSSGWSPWMTWACIGGGVVLVSLSVLVTMAVMRRKQGAPGE